MWQYPIGRLPLRNLRDSTQSGTTFPVIDVTTVWNQAVAPIINYNIWKGKSVVGPNMQ